MNRGLCSCSASQKQFLFVCFEQFIVDLVSVLVLFTLCLLIKMYRRLGRKIDECECCIYPFRWEYMLFHSPSTKQKSQNI